MTMNKAELCCPKLKLNTEKTLETGQNDCLQLIRFDTFS